MFTCSIADAIVHMAELTLQRGTRDKALIVPLRVERSGQLICCFDFFLYRPNNYMKVGVVHTLTHRTPLFGARHSIWTLKCDHDSGWRDDGVRSALWDLHKTLAYGQTDQASAEMQEPSLVSVEADGMRIDHAGRAIHVMYKVPV